jgi:hypothetical protein
MNTLNRLVQAGVIAGFLISASGCIIAPDRGHDRVVREHDYRDRDRHDHYDRHCDDRNEHCRDH